MKTPPKISLLFLAFVFCAAFAQAQQFVPLWEGVSMPNSKGGVIDDRVENERYLQVGRPGIFAFYPSLAENRRAAVLIIPGGGYARLAYEISGMQLAKWFNTIGVAAFVLIHRLPQSPDVIESHKAPLQDAQRALRWIRANAARHGIDESKIGVMGSSAGAHLAACASTITEDWSNAGDALDKFSFSADFTILVSPVISMGEYTHKGSRENLLGREPSAPLLELFSLEKQVTVKTPPAFIVHAANDRSVSCMNSILYFTALKKNTVANCTLHIFPEGGHEIALRNNPGTTAHWTALCEGWLAETQIAPPLKK